MSASQLRAFARTYRAEGPFVAAVLGRLAVPSEAVHDAVQDVFVAAYRRWPDFDDTRPVRPWLTAFAHRVAFRYRRSQARRERKRAALRHVHPAAARSGAGQADARAFLDRFLAELSEGHREAFLRSDLEGQSAAEVAEALGISAEAVYGRVRSVRKRLHRALMDDARNPGSRAAGLVPPWATLLPQLGVGSSLATTGLGLSGLKVFAATLAVSTVGLVTVGVVSAEPDVSSEVTVASTREPDVLEQRDPPRLASAASTTAPPALPPTPVAAPSPRPQTPKGTAPAAPVDEASPLHAEAELLRRAKQAQAAGRLEEALGLLDTHGRRFPSGQLATGRQRARIRVLCDLGRTAQARGEAKMLASKRPDDPLAVQALSICAAPIQSPAQAEKQG